MEFQAHPKLATMTYQLGADVRVVRLERTGEITHITIADRVYEVRVIHSRAAELTFEVDGVIHTAFIATEEATQYLAIDGEEFELKQPAAQRARRKQQHGEDNLTASMPGQVIKVLVKDGDSVQRGQPLLVLEAMKMEIKIAAPRHGRIARLLVHQGQVVARGQALLELASE